MLRNLSFKPVAVCVVGLLLTWLVLVPLAVLVLSAFKPTGMLKDPGFTLEHLFIVYSDPWFWGLVLNTLVFAVGSAAMALVIGGALAWLIERTDLPGRSFFRGFAILPMVMPPFLLAMSWIMLISPRTGAINQFWKQWTGSGDPLFDIYTMGGMIFVEGLAIVPSAFLILSPAMRNIDPSLEEAAMMSGAKTSLMLRRILFPLLRPAVLAVVIYLFVVCCVIFDIPGTIGMPGRIYVVSTYTFSLLTENPRGLPDYAKVSAMGLMFIALLMGLALLYQYLTKQSRRFITVSGKNFRPRMFKLGRARPFALAAVCLYFLASVIAPLAVLIWTSFMPWLVQPSLTALQMLTLKNHADFLANPFVLEASLNSLVIGVFSATAVAAISLAVAWLVGKSKVRGRGALDIISFMPLAFPGVLIAIALMYVYLYFPGLGIYGTIWIIAIAYTTVYLSFGSRSMMGFVSQLHPELEEAAMTSGAGPLLTIRRVIIPLTLPALGAVWLWVFSHALRELSAALTLQGIDNATVPTILYSYWSGGEPNKAAAAGVWLLMALLLLILLGQLLKKLTRKER